MYQALYDSPLWLPILPTAFAAVVICAVLVGAFRDSPQVRAFAGLFATLAAADAWLGGPWSPLPASGALTTASVVFFVILGDFRYFLATRMGAIPLRRAVLRAAALAFVVPVLTQIVVRIPFPNLGDRTLYLVYELAFLVVIVADYARAPRPLRSRALFRFECMQYALWAAADVLILRGVEAGYLLRILPNVMYYAAFVPFAAVVVSRRKRPAVALAIAALLCAACTTAKATPDVALRFSVDGHELRSVALADIAAKSPPVVIATDDPYYGKTKHFRAVTLEAALASGFVDAQGHAIPADGREYVLRAKDGYAVPFTDAALHEGGAYLAFADEDVAGFEPIGPQRVSPFPLYLIWTKPGQGNLESHPRPWQLDSVEMVRFDVASPHLAPPAQATPADQERVIRGLATFRAQCFKCHAINREGGRTGPELNVPKNVFEYLPAEFVRAYVRKPSDFRYGIMPSHEDMAPADLDDLMAYLRAMKDAKFDPK